MTDTARPELSVVDLGRRTYEEAYKVQIDSVERVIADRDRPTTPNSVGHLLLVEHDPVITITRRPGVREHLLATPESLARHGVSIAETDRGGDITYHGPGQLVVYPILDLNRLNLGLHAYMSLLESAVIAACTEFGVQGHTDPQARGVWVADANPALPAASQPAKVCAMGVRVRRWVSFHGLALNVDPDMTHFQLIVPCGLAGRPVTSLARLLGTHAPSMEAVKSALVRSLRSAVLDAASRSASAVDEGVVRSEDPDGSIA